MMKYGNETDEVKNKGFNSRGILLLWICVPLLFLAGCRGEQGETGGKTGRQAQISAPSGLSVPDHASFVSETELGAVLANGGENPKTEFQYRNVRAVVAPHHLLAGGLICQVMEILAEQKPERIIVVGPNHYNKGKKIITGFYNWQTPEGTVETDRQTVQALAESNLAAVDEEVLSQEHSVGALAPLIKHFLPGTKIVPIILHHGVNLEEINALLTELDPLLDDKTILLASVDFSHYLTRTEAQAKDRETIDYMKDHDYATILRLGNDHLDSPPSLVTALKLGEKKGMDFTVLGNTNSGIILQNDQIETTSYFTLLFGERE